MGEPVIDGLISSVRPKGGIRWARFLGWTTAQQPYRNRKRRRSKRPRLEARFVSFVASTF